MPLLLLEKNSFLYFHLYDLPFRLNIGIKMKNEVGKQFPLWDIPVLPRTRKNVFINLIEVDRNSFTVHKFVNRFQKKK